MLKFDFSDFDRAARQMGAFADQVPFAISKAMNDSVRIARQKIITETWPQHVTVRKPAFLAWALRTEFATKTKLWVEINDERANGRGHLALHDEGGIKVARGRLAIPGKYVKRNGSGVVMGQRPRNLPNAFIKGDVIYQRVGPKNPIYIKKNGKRGKLGGSLGKSANGSHVRGLRVMYVLRSSADIKADVPFHRDFERIMQAEIARAFPKRMEEAMRTAFRR